MTGRWPFWLVVTRVTTVSVKVFLVMDSLKRPNSVGGGGNSSPFNCNSLAASASFIRTDDKRRGGGGGDDGGDGYRPGFDMGRLVRIGTCDDEDFKLLFKGGGCCCCCGGEL